MDRGTLAEKLRLAGYLDAAGIERAMEARGRHGSFEEALVRIGLIEEIELVRAICRLTRTPAVDLTAKTIEPDVLALVTPATARKFRCLPLFASPSPPRLTGPMSTRSTLFLGFENPLDDDLRQEVALGTGLQVRPVVVGPVQLSEAIERFYPASPGDDAVPAVSVSGGDTAPLVNGAEPVEVAEELRGEGPAAPGDPDEEDGRRREIPTRIILQALTKILVANGLVDRQQLMREISEIRAQEAAARNH